MIVSLAVSLAALDGCRDKAKPVAKEAAAPPAGYFDEPDFEGSEAELEAVAAGLRARIEESPSDPFLYGTLGNLYEEYAITREHAGLPHREYVKKALEAYRKSVELRPGAETPDRGNNLEAVGRLHGALGNLDEAVRWQNRAAAAMVYACPHLALGNLYRRAGDVAGAEKSLREALKLEPNRRAPRLLMALHYFETGRLDEAAAQLDAAPMPGSESDGSVAEHGGGNQPDVGAAPLLALRGFILILRPDFSAAERVLEECATRFGRSRLVLLGLAHVANARKDYASARSHLEAALRAPAYVDDTDAYVAQAIKVFEQGMLQLGLAWLEGNTGNHEAAARHFRQILASRPSHTLALLGLGNSLTVLERNDEATKVFEKVLAMEPRNAYALAGLGTLALNRGALREAEELLKRAKEESDESYSCPYEGLGLLFLRQGLEGAAAAHFTEAIERQPGIEYRKYDGLARILMKQGRLERARDLLRKSLRNHPEGKDARELLKQVEERLAATPAGGE